MMRYHEPATATCSWYNPDLTVCYIGSL